MNKVFNINDRANITIIPFEACEISAGLNSICEAIAIDKYKNSQKEGEGKIYEDSGKLLASITW